MANRQLTAAALLRARWHAFTFKAHGRIYCRSESAEFWRVSPPAPSWGGRGKGGLASEIPSPLCSDTSTGGGGGSAAVAAAAAASLLGPAAGACNSLWGPAARLWGPAAISASVAPLCASQNPRSTPPPSALPGSAASSMRRPPRLPQRGCHAVAQPGYAQGMQNPASRRPHTAQGPSQSRAATACCQFCRARGGEGGG